ncbi:hypothetical protein D3C84_1075440 [compost metagenome]
MPLFHTHFLATRLQPTDVLDAQAFVILAGEETISPQQWVAVAQLDEVADKLLQLAALFTHIPVYPADLAVLAVGIVAAALGPGKLVSRQEHGRTL